MHLEECNMVKYEGKCVVDIHVNGENRSVAVRPSDVLLDVLRDQ